MQKDKAVLVPPCANVLIRAFFWHLREGDMVSFKLRRKRGLVSHPLTLCFSQKAVMGKINAGIATATIFA